MVAKELLLFGTSNLSGCTPRAIQVIFSFHLFSSFLRQLG